MTDFHTHILPAIDDGSASAEESMAMIRALQEQGATRILATSHFYAGKEAPEEFLAHRKKAMDTLTEAMPEVKDLVIPGAEVLYYFGIERLQELSALTIGGTRLLLLELPFSHWADSVIREVLAIQRDRGFQVVLAHIDRYLAYHNNKAIEDFIDEGILLQVNAGAFENRKTKKAVLHLMAKQQIRFIGSDCHDTERRKPNLDVAIKTIEKNFGPEAVAWFEHSLDEYWL